MGAATATPGVSWPPKLIELNGRLAVHGALTAREWDIFDALLKQHDPVAHKARRDEARRQVRLDGARELSIEDLEMVLKEKRK